MSWEEKPHFGNGNTAEPALGVSTNSSQQQSTAKTCTCRLDASIGSSKVDIKTLVVSKVFYLPHREAVLCAASISITRTLAQKTMPFSFSSQCSSSCNNPAPYEVCSAGNVVWV